MTATVRNRDLLYKTQKLQIFNSMNGFPSASMVLASRNDTQFNVEKNDDWKKNRQFYFLHSMLTYRMRAQINSTFRENNDI